MDEEQINLTIGLRDYMIVGFIVIIVIISSIAIATLILTK